MTDIGNTYDRSMYYNAKQETKQRAKELRSSLTKTETILWNKLRNNKLKGLKFRRQHPIDIYISDFYCHKIQLVIEIDGFIHNSRDQKNWDMNRDATFKSFGITILRFSNNQVTNEIDKVICEISQKSDELLTKLSLQK